MVRGLHAADLVTAVWVGYPEAQREMTDVHGTQGDRRLVPRRDLGHVHEGALGDYRPATSRKPDGLTVVRVLHGDRTRAPPSTARPRCHRPVPRRDTSPRAAPCTRTAERSTFPNLVGMTKEKALALLKQAHAALQGRGADVPRRRRRYRGSPDAGAGQHGHHADGRHHHGIERRQQPTLPPNGAVHVRPRRARVGQSVAFDASCSQRRRQHRHVRTGSSVTAPRAKDATVRTRSTRSGDVRGHPLGHR